MSSFIFDGEIDVESVTELLEAVKEGANTIYMSTAGGNISLIDIICRELKENNCTLIGFDHLASSGTQVFFKYTGCKELLPGTQMAFHHPTVRIDIREANRSKCDRYHKNCDSLQVDSLKWMWKDWVNDLRCYGLSEEMIKEIESGETVYLDWDEVQKLNFGPSYGTKQKAEPQPVDVTIYNELLDLKDWIEDNNLKHETLVGSIDNILSLLKNNMGAE